MERTKLKLIAKSNLYSDFGWMVEGVREFDTLTMVGQSGGRVLAHDIFEHVNGLHRIGDIDDELEAIGASWYIRGQFGGLDDLKRTDPYQGLSSDVASTYEDYIATGVTIVAPVAVETTHDCDLEEIVRLATEKILKIADQENEERTAAYLAAALPLLQSGFLKAQAKYPEAYLISSMFDTVAGVLDTYLADAELYEGAEADLEFWVEFGTPLAECNQIIEEVEDYEVEEV